MAAKCLSLSQSATGRGGQQMCPLYPAAPSLSVPGLQVGKQSLGYIVEEVGTVIGGVQEAIGWSWQRKG